MAYDEFLSERIQRVYQEKKAPFFAKKMFGGIDPAHFDMDEDLEYWINLAIEYNPKVKSSKK